MHVVKITHEFRGVTYDGPGQSYTLTYEQAKQIREALLSLGSTLLDHDQAALEFMYIAVWKRFKRAQLDHLPHLTNALFSYGVKHGSSGLRSKYEASMQALTELYESGEPPMQFIKSNRPVITHKIRHVVPFCSTHSCLLRLEKQYIRRSL